MILQKQTDGILIKLRNDPLCGFSRDGMFDLLKEKLHLRVQKAWIFGSFALDRMHSFSDIDLILVQETDKPFISRPEDFDDLLDIGPVLDILVYTPGEFKNLISPPLTGFWKTAVESMIRLV
jgi:predicted nucleotidyltransferase